MALTFKSVFKGAGKVLKTAAPVIGGVLGGLAGPAGAAVGTAIGGAIAGGGGGKVKSYDAIPSDVTGLRKQTASWLGNNMNDLKQTPATSATPTFERTANVATPGMNQLERAQSGQDANPYGRYRGLENVNTQQTTASTRSGNILDQLMAVNGGTDPRVAQILLSGGGGVSAGKIAGLTEGQQSVSDLATQGFMDKMLQQYNPYFEQARQKALAQAKEASGNLTGSGFANALGTSTNESIAQQQAQLAQLAQFGISQEMARQQGLAGFENQRNIAQAGNELSASAANAGNMLQGALGYGNLSQNGTNQRLQALLGAGSLDLNNRTLDSNEQQRNMGYDLEKWKTLAGLQQNDAQSQAQRDQQTNLFNAGAANDREQFVANLAAQLGMNNRQLSSQENQFLASLLQNNNQFNAGQTNGVNNSNAQRIAQLLGGMTSAGVGVPQQTQEKGFLDSLIGGVSGALPYLFKNKQVSGGSPSVAPIGMDRIGMTPGSTGTSIPQPPTTMSLPPGLFSSTSFADPRMQPMATGSATGSPGVSGGASFAPGGASNWMPPTSGLASRSDGWTPGQVSVPGASGGSPFAPGGGSGWTPPGVQSGLPTFSGQGGLPGLPMNPSSGMATGGSGPQSWQGASASGGPGPGQDALQQLLASGGRPPLGGFQAGGIPGQSSIAQQPQALQGLLASLKGMGQWGQTGGGLTNRDTFLSQLPMLRVAG